MTKPQICVTCFGYFVSNRLLFPREMNVARVVEVINARRVLVGRPKWKRSCWGPGFRWKGIKMRLS